MSNILGKYYNRSRRKSQSLRLIFDSERRTDPVCWRSPFDPAAVLGEVGVAGGVWT